MFAMYCIELDNGLADGPSEMVSLYDVMKAMNEAAHIPGGIAEIYRLFSAFGLSAYQRRAGGFVPVKSPDADFHITRRELPDIFVERHAARLALCKSYPDAGSVIREHLDRKVKAEQPSTYGGLEGLTAQPGPSP